MEGDDQCRCCRRFLYVNFQGRVSSRWVSFNQEFPPDSGDVGPKDVIAY